MSKMFTDNRLLNSDVSKWDVRKVINFDRMFKQCAQMKQFLCSPSAYPTAWTDVMPWTAISEEWCNADLGYAYSQDVGDCAKNEGSGSESTSTPGQGGRRLCGASDCQNFDKILTLKDYNGESESACKTCQGTNAQQKKGAYALNMFEGSGVSVQCCAKGQYYMTPQDNPTGLPGCSKCPQGYSQPKKNMKITECIPCANGKATGPDGFECKDCEPGFFQDGSSPSACAKCDAGRYNSEKGLEDCSDCPAGQYGAVRGAVNCVECIADSFGDAPKKTSPADCTKCEIQKTTNQTTGATSSSECMCERSTYLDPNDNTCASCDEETMACDTVGLTLDSMITRPGYWRRSVNDTIFFQCRNQEDCVGGILEYQCGENRGGTLCAVCFDQHVRVDTDCIACPPGQGRGGNSSTGILVGFTPCIVVFVVLVYYFARREKDIKTTNVTKVSPVLKNRKDVTSTLEPNYQNVKAKEENAGRCKRGTPPTSGACCFFFFFFFFSFFSFFSSLTSFLFYFQQQLVRFS